MKYVGIDLGTTNSAICSYDGESVRLYKSPDQKDVTPSAIFIDRRGNKYLGDRAYDNAAKNPDNAATKFKRMMGTSTPVKLAAVNIAMTPEECSAEILKLCFGYLPEEIRNGEETGTVITVPAAFNQMQKDATLAAAEMASLGSVALMQEPVAAVMCVMKQRKGDGIFLVFDLGGGTLDIAIAESISSRVSLLAHGGIAMCGGTDFDRSILDNVVKPWLKSNFDLPDDFSASQKYKPLLRMCLWASEKAKIELSAKEDLGLLGRAELPQGEARAASPAPSVLSASRRWFGERVRMLRKRNGLTLQELSNRTGLAESTLSRIENGKLSITYDNIVELANGLESDVSALLSPSGGAEMIGRRTVTRAGAGLIYESDQYVYDILCPEIARKKFIPLRTVVKARSILEFGELTKHSGEEFIYVISGVICVHTDGYEPTTLGPGDCIYFDSMTGHAVTNDADSLAEILWVCTNPEFPPKPGNSKG